MSVRIDIDVEIIATILLPCFDATRDFFLKHALPDGEHLEKVRKVKLIVDSKVHDTPRHYMGCSDNGLRIFAAPEAALLPTEIIVPMFAHEFGHACDFLYPGRWFFRDRARPASWLRDDDRRRAQHVHLWQSRSADQIEWSADAIAYAVTGQRITYAGECLLQSFDRGVPRPEGLR